MIDGLKPYAEYKESGQEWLGGVPAHWDLKPGHAAFAKRKESNLGMKEKTVLSLSYGRIKVKATDKQHGLVPESYETYQVVNEGNVIIRGTDLQNDHTSLRIGLSRNRGIISSAYLCLEAQPTITPDYGYQILNVFDLTKAIYRYGSGLRQNLDHGEIKRLPIFLPPLDEQAAIVRFLDNANRKIDGFIRAKRKLIGLLNEQKQAIIHRAVTRGLHPDVPLKPSGIPWLGDIPKHWEVLALKRVLRRLIDCEHKTAPAAEGSGLRVVRTTGIRHGRLQFHGTYGTTPEALKQWTRRGLPEAGDVLFTREAPAGEACVMPEGITLCMGQRTVLMKLRANRINAHFLVHSIYGGPPRTAITLASQGSTVGHFNMSDIGALTVFLPPHAEQVVIVEAIERDAEPLNTAIARTEREIALMQEYRTRLTSDIVTGKLDVREAAAHLPAPPTAAVTEATADEPLEEIETEEIEA